VGVGGFVKCKIPKVVPISYRHTDVSDSSMYIVLVEDISFVNAQYLEVVKNEQPGTFFPLRVSQAYASIH
jgi:hypothetical protein